MWSWQAELDRRRHEGGLEASERCAYEFVSVPEQMMMRASQHQSSCIAIKPCENAFSVVNTEMNKDLVIVDVHDRLCEAAVTMLS